MLIKWLNGQSHICHMLGSNLTLLLIGSDVKQIFDTFTQLLYLSTILAHFDFYASVHTFVTTFQMVDSCTPYRLHLPISSTYELGYFGQLNYANVLNW